MKIIGWDSKAPMWAKCDMLSTVSFERLNKPYKKIWQGPTTLPSRSTPPDLAAVKAGIRAYLAL